MEVLGIELESLGEQPVLLTAELPLQPPYVLAVSISGEIVTPWVSLWAPSEWVWLLLLKAFIIFPA